MLAPLLTPLCGIELEITMLKKSRINLKEIEQLVHLIPKKFSTVQASMLMCIQAGNVPILRAYVHGVSDILLKSPEKSISTLISTIRELLDIK